jgi:hypothetical protein
MELHVSTNVTWQMAKKTTQMEAANYGESGVTNGREIRTASSVLYPTLWEKQKGKEDGIH